MNRAGPLARIRVVELGGIGPAPFCAMMLADMGADVVRVERAGGGPELPLDPARNILHRGRRTLTLDLKQPDGRDMLLALAEHADVLLEGFRPRVMERLGLGPDAVHALNPRLVYARMTGWGQDGPLADRAGHDINYLALSGTLWMCGRADERPSPNLNIGADMGGGGMMMAFGIAAALLHAARTGEGQVIDAAMLDGAGLIAIQAHALRAMGLWEDARGANLLDGGAPFYDVYEAACCGFVAVGAIEPDFYAQLIAGLGLERADLPHQHDRSRWPELKARFAAAFATRTRDEWAEAFAETDACVTPVLTPAEAAEHPHNRARATWRTFGKVAEPLPAPRFSVTPGGIAACPPVRASDAAAILTEWRR